MVRKSEGANYSFPESFLQAERTQNAWLGYFKMAALNPALFIQKIIQKKLILLLRFFDKRKSKRVRLPRPTRCEIFNLATERMTHGWIEDISSGGLRVLSLDKTLNGVTLRLSFQDRVMKKRMSLYVIPILADVKRPFHNKRFQFMQEYRCPAHPDVIIPEHFVHFYQRALSDSYVRDLNQKQVPAPVVKIGRKKMELKIASTKEEKEAAYRLVYQEYVKRRFIEPNAYGIFTHRYHLLPDTATIVGIRDPKEVVATISVMRDAAFGLPSDYLFKDAIDKVRQESGRRIVEFGMLSTQKGLFGKHVYSLSNYHKLSSLFNMFRMTAQYSLEICKATDIIITIPQRFENLYKYLCFERIADLRSYDKYNNTPMLIMRMSLQKVNDPKHMQSIDRLCLMRFFFGRKVTVEPPPIFSPETANYLFAEKSDLMKRLSAEELQVMYQHYPEMRFWLSVFMPVHKKDALPEAVKQFKNNVKENSK